jgi:hypothetical protein
LNLFLAATLVAAQPIESWVREFRGAASEEARVGKLVLDPASNVYVLGAVGPTNRMTNDLLLLKYAPDGELLWSARLDGGGHEWPVGLALDAQHNVVIGGASTRGQLIAKFDPKGSLLWRHVELNLLDYPFFGEGALVIDAVQNVIFAAADLTIKLDAAGRRLWRLPTRAPTKLAATPRKARICSPIIPFGRSVRRAKARSSRTPFARARYKSIRAETCSSVDRATGSTRWCALRRTERHCGSVVTSASRRGELTTHYKTTLRRFTRRRTATSSSPARRRGFLPAETSQPRCA